MVKRILIADDSFFMREMIKRLFSKYEFDVIGEAENGREAAEKYKELMPDLVTLDITMNEMTGLEALKEILEFDPDAKVIMVSAMGGQSWIVDEAMTSGARGILTKPFKDEDVAAMIEMLGW